MIQSFIHTSDNNNSYIYDDHFRLSMLVHPEIKKANEKVSEVDPYYLKKYAYLKKHGFFTKPKLAEFSMLEKAMVVDNIINIKQVVFEVTDSCNLKCTYCSLGELYKGFDARNGRNMNVDYAINLLKYVFSLKPKDRNTKLFVSFYGGEALLNLKFIRRIVEVVTLLNAKKEIDVEYSMTTNATLIHKYIDFLVVNKFRLLISLDGDEKNHSYRILKKNGRNSFRRVIENIDMIKRRYPEYFLNYINFNAVLHNRNSVKEIYEFIYNRYRKIPRIAELNLRDVRLENKDVLERMFHSKKKSEYEYRKENSRYSLLTHEESLQYKDLSNFLRYYSINYYISNISALLHVVERYLPTSTCTPFSKKIFLTNRNKLLPCEKVSYDYTMGSVKADVEIDIDAVVKKYNYYYMHLKKYCQYCYAYKFCGVCLFHIDNIDRVDSEEFLCDKFQDQNAFKKRLFAVFSYLEKYPNDFSEILENVIIE